MRQVPASPAFAAFEILIRDLPGASPGQESESGGAPNGERCAGGPDRPAEEARVTRGVSVVAIAIVSIAAWSGLPARAQAPGGGSAPAIARAQEQLATHDVAGAIATLEVYLATGPGAPATASARLLLGRAFREKGDLERALAAFLAVPETPRPPRLQALFAAAGIHAGRGRKDEALALLGELEGSGAFDMDRLRTAPELADLVGDPRFDALMFLPSDFARPLVEPVRVIHEWVAENKGDQFGWIARSLDDVDRDGVRDVVTSAPTFGAGGRPIGAGRVYVYSGKSGRLLWQATGRDGEGLGLGLEGAGDVDVDGAEDVVAGAPGDNRAYVYSGRDGKLLLSLRSPRTEDEGYGTSTSGVGDQNGDGHADVLVGAPGPVSGPATAGRAYLHSGKDGALLLTLAGEADGDGYGSMVAGVGGEKQKLLLVSAPAAGAADTGRVYAYAGLAAAPRFVFEADATGTALGGMFTSVVGDVDGDGVADVYASDYQNAARGPATGRAYVWSGADGRLLRTWTGEQAGDGFADGSADAGDVDRDGHADLVLGAWQHATGAPSGGRVYLYSGKDGHLIRSITARVPGETLGFDATGAGDVDGDGTPDLLLTSAWSNIVGFRSGRMFVISGR
jgi:hypothetical protein